MSPGGRIGWVQKSYSEFPLEWNWLALERGTRVFSMEVTVIPIRFQKYKD